MKENITEQQLQEISRRAFLWKSAKTAAGVAVAGTALGMIAPKNVFAADTEPFEYTFNEPGPGALPHPMEYQKLDPDEARARAYKAYQEKGG